MNQAKQLTNTEISSFCRQTAMIIQAGITPSEGMDILLHDTLDKSGKKLLQNIGLSCKKGDHFYAALGATGVFPAYVIHSIALGEESGNLDTVLISLAQYYDREENITESIKSAVSYPLIMIGMMLLVIVVLIVKVLPIFQQVFTQLGTEMGPFATSLLHIGNILSSYSIVLAVIFFLVVLGSCILYCTHTGKQLIKRFLSHFPLTRNFFEKMAAGRFASGMALSMASGMDTYLSLDLVAQLVDHNGMSAKIELCKKDIQDGDNLSEALNHAKIFSNLYSRMVSVGFKSGSIDSVMKQIAQNYENETDRQISRIISIIEPTLVIFLSLIVGSILMSVILPLIGIMSSIG